MLSTDSNGVQTRSLNKLSKVYYESLAKADMYFDQFLDIRMSSMQNQGKIHSFVTTGNLTPVSTAHVEGGAVAIDDIALATASVEVFQYAKKVPLTDFLLQTAELDMEKIVKDKLAINTAESEDTLAYELVFDATNWVAVPAGGNSATALTFTQNGVAATANTGRTITKKHLQVLANTLKMARVKTHPKTGTYVLIGTPTSLQDLKDELEDVFKYTESSVGRTISGKMGVYNGFTIIEQNLIATNDVFAFGSDCGVKLIVQPARILMDELKELETSFAIGWKSILGYGKVQNNRIIKWVGQI